jgi:hypothetical protein
VVQFGSRGLIWPPRWQLRTSCHSTQVDNRGGGIGVADVLDSAIAAWSASLIATGRAERLPLG